MNNNSTRRRWLVVLVFVFVVSRLAYTLIGIKFDMRTLPGFWQFLDPELLRHDLLRSLWYQHTQPPLYNLLLGLVLKVSGRHTAEVFHFVYMAAGFGLSLSLYGIATGLGVDPRRAALAVAILIVSPTVVLYETWLYVEYLIAALLAIATFAALRFVNDGRIRWAIGLFIAVAAVVAARTLFHLMFLVFVFALVWYLQPNLRRQILIAACVPLALVSAIYIKNFALFRQLTSTSCFGISAARVTTFQLSEKRRHTMTEKGKLSRYALVDPFMVPYVYPNEFKGTPTGVPVLDQPVKSTGYSNLDAKPYLRVCRAYLTDAIKVARTEPGTILRSMRVAALVFFRPADDYYWFQDHRSDETSRIHFLDRAYDFLIWGQPVVSPRILPQQFTPSKIPRRLLEVGWFIVGAYVVALVAATRRLRELGQAGRRTPEGLVLCLILAVVAYVGLVGNLFEAGENNRFRFLLDPLVLGLLLIVTRSWGRSAKTVGLRALASIKRKDA